MAGPNLMKLKGVKTSGIDLSEATLTNVLELSTNSGANTTADSMTANPETQAEAGYITIDIGGTSYQIPIYAA